MRTIASLTLLRTQSDARLVELTQAGHERAFEAIVERYRRELARACRRILPDGRAEDALQQTLLAAWTALGNGTEVTDLRAWLHRIARNTSLNALRVSGYDYDELRESLAGADAVGEEAERRAVMRQTLAAVAAMPEPQREALLRTAVQGQPQEQIARELGVSTGAVRMLVHRARVTLRSAATAITPVPLAAWLAAAGARAGEPMAAKIAEAAAGAGTIGVSAALAKAGAVVVIGTGAAIGTPLALDRIDGTVEGPRSRSAAAATASPSPTATPEPAATVAPSPSPSPTATPEAVAAGARDDDDRGGDRRRGRGRGGDDRSEREDRDDERSGGSGSGSGKREDERDDAERSGSSGSGGSSGSSGSSSSGGSSGSSGSGGSGGGDDDSHDDSSSGKGSGGDGD